VLTVGVVGTFAVGWLLPRLGAFREKEPFIDLRIATNNNRVDLAGDGLDCAIRFGNGAWHGTEAVAVLAAPMTPLCGPSMATRLLTPADVAGETLLRSYRSETWGRWFDAAGVTCPRLAGPVFDSSSLMVEAAIMGLGVALAPASMFERQLAAGRLADPFAIEVAAGAYWLSWLKSKTPTPALQAFQTWLIEEAGPTPQSPDS
jgi:LysR family transcriptional regulator, regulator of gene expression of beta-lactamase